MTVKLLVINGGPRKNWNTGMMLQSAISGAESFGAETELVHLYSLNYKGCISCFSCKLKDGKSYGKCALNDDLLPVLRKVEESDAVLIGSPIYLGDVTGAVRSFLERFVFQYLMYSNDAKNLFGKRIKVGFVYTMNAGAAQAERYSQFFSTTENLTGRFFGETRSIYAVDTLQFDDYSKYVSDRFDPEAKKRSREEEFPKDLKMAFDLGAWLVSE